MGIYSTSPRIYTVDYGINRNKDKKGAYNPEARTKSIRVGNVPELRGSAHCARSHSIPKIQQLNISKNQYPGCEPSPVDVGRFTTQSQSRCQCFTWLLARAIFTAFAFLFALASSCS